MEPEMKVSMKNMREPLTFWKKNINLPFCLDVMFYSFLFDWYSIVAIIVAIKNALTQKEVTTATFAMQYS